VPAPLGASEDGPPAPRRLEQPSPWTLPISDTSRRCGGHRLTGSRTGRKLVGFAPGLTRAAETTAFPRLGGVEQRESRRLPSYRDRSSFWIAQAALGTRCGALRADCTHRSHLGAAAACVSRSCGDLLGQRPEPTRLAASPCRGARCVGPTSAFSRLRMSTRASLGSRGVMQAHAFRGDRLCHVRTIRFGGSHMASRPRALSSRNNVCEPCLWHPCRLSHGAHRARARVRSYEPPRSLSACSRERYTRLRDRECLPPVESSRSATPFRAPGSSFHQRRGLATAIPVLDAVASAATFFGSLQLGSRPRARCQRRSRFLESWRRSPTSAT